MNCKRRYAAVFFIAWSIFLSSHPLMAFPNEPVALVLQPIGVVQYSSTGKIWEPVYRNKFLFPGNHLKTAESSSCIIMNQLENTTWTLEKQSEVVINDKGVELISGTLSEGEPATNLLGNIKRKFASVQKYTVILRSPTKETPLKFQTVNTIILCEEFPDIVWENAGNQYSYELIVGDDVYHIPETQGDIVRFKMPPLEPGKYFYRVKALRDDKVMFESDEKNILMWLPDMERKSLLNQISLLNKFDSNNKFLIGNYLDEQGVKVAAMDSYLNFFQNNPDAKELKPFLIKIYDDLKLNKLKEKEKLMIK